MTRHVLLPIDGSPQSQSALEFALREFPEANITLIHVIDPVEAGFSSQATAFGRAEEWYDEAREIAEELFEDARERAADGGHEGSVDSTVELGRPARTIVDYADENDVDQIVLGSHGRSGVSRILLGSVAETVVRRSPVPVTVVR